MQAGPAHDAQCPVYLPNSSGTYLGSNRGTIPRQGTSSFGPCEPGNNTLTPLALTTDLTMKPSSINIYLEHHHLRCVDVMGAGQERPFNIIKCEYHGHTRQSTYTRV
jgi:hypothetical protein